MLAPESIDAAMAHYEGLCRKTAALIADRVEDDYDDLVQVFRIKVFKALQAYNPQRCRTSRDSFVFSCVYNQSKDLLKRRRIGGLLFIEDITSDGDSPGEVAQRDRFERQYLVLDADQAFQDVEDEGVQLPSTLTSEEREVVWLLYLDYSYAEIAREIGMTRRQVERHLSGVREKMAELRPVQDEPEPVPLAA